MIPEYVRQLKEVINDCNCDSYGVRGSVERAEALHCLAARVAVVIERGEIQLALLDDYESTRRFIMGLLPELACAYFSFRDRQVNTTPLHCFADEDTRLRIEFLHADTQRLLYVMFQMLQYELKVEFIEETFTFVPRQPKTIPLQSEQEPDILNRPEIKEVFNKAIEKELMDEEGNWLESKSLLAFFCQRIFFKYLIKPHPDLNPDGSPKKEWKPFEEYFRVNKKRVELREAFKNAKNNPPRKLFLIDDIIEETTAAKADREK